MLAICRNARRWLWAICGKAHHAWGWIRLVIIGNPAWQAWESPPGPLHDIHIMNALRGRDIYFFECSAFYIGVGSLCVWRDALRTSALLHLEMAVRFDMLCDFIYWILEALRLDMVRLICSAILFIESLKLCDWIWCGWYALRFYLLNPWSFAIGYGRFDMVRPPLETLLYICIVALRFYLLKPWSFALWYGAIWYGESSAWNSALACIETTVWER